MNREFARRVFYLTAALLYIIATVVDWEIFLSNKAHKHGVTGHRRFGGRLKFLTFIDMVFI